MVLLSMASWGQVVGPERAWLGLGRTLTVASAANESAGWHLYTATYRETQTSSGLQLLKWRTGCLFVWQPGVTTSPESS